MSDGNYRQGRPLLDRVARGEENLVSGGDQSRAAVERIRARARSLSGGEFEWDAVKVDRDAGRP